MPFGILREKGTKRNLLDDYNKMIEPATGIRTIFGILCPQRNPPGNFLANGVYHWRKPAQTKISLLGT